MYMIKNGFIKDENGENVCQFWDKFENDFKDADKNGKLICDLLNGVGVSSELKPWLAAGGVKQKAEELTCKHLTNKFCDTHKHWCYNNIYNAILFTLKKMGMGSN